MAHGKTIRIYLADGSASGIRHAEIVNWTGQGIVCPRGRVSELANWEESKRPGVYMLVGDDPDGSKPLVYIGEAEIVFARLKHHLADANKEFWDQVVFFTSKDENLTKSHVKYLEARMVEIASEIGRVSLKNGTAPSLPSLPRADRDSMEEFLGPARLLLSALGFNALQPIVKHPGADPVGPSGPLADVLLRCVLKKRLVEATGHATDEGLVVLTGSTGSSVLLDTLTAGWRTLRDELVAEGAIVDAGTHVKFTRDVLFKSPSAAAAVLVGGSRNGRLVWKDENDKTLGELEDALLVPDSSDPE